MAHQTATVTGESFRHMLAFPGLLQGTWRVVLTKKKNTSPKHYNRLLSYNKAKGTSLSASISTSTQLQDIHSLIFNCKFFVPHIQDSGDLTKDLDPMRQVSARIAPSSNCIQRRRNSSPFMFLIK